MEISPAPIQEIHDPLFVKKDVQVYIKREDLNHPVVSGNKWRKLKYNLQEAKSQGLHTVLTFGGAYSNHIHATAGAGQALGLKTIGIIRGEETLPLNDTLTFAKSCGMEIHYMDRSTYREKDSLKVKLALQYEFEDFYLIPEGGTNQLAIKGCEELISELEEGYDHYCLPVGTGGTIAGVVSGLKGAGKIIGFSSLKGDFLGPEVKVLVSDYTGKSFDNWEINNDYHFGGYARTKPELFEFMKSFEDRHKVLLDPIYTAKSLYGLHQLIHTDYFPTGSSILFIHTGGLQGRKGFGL